MKRSRKLVASVALLLILLIATAAPAFAQLPEPFCGSLSEEDCAILIDSQDASLAVESSSSYVDVDILIAGIPGLPADELAFNYTQDSVAALDPALALEIAQMQQMPADELMENMDMMTEAVLDLYADIALDTDISFTMPQEVADLASAQAGIEVPNELTAMFRMVDGYGYANIDELAAQIPELEGFSGWYGIDVLSLMQMGFEESMSSANADSPDMAASFTGFGLTSFLNSEEGRAMLEEYVEIERLDDETVDGQDVAVFSSTFDFGRFIGSPVFAEMLMSQRETINTALDMDLSESQLNEALSLLPMFGPMLFTGLDFEIIQRIGLEDYYVYESELTFHWDLSSIIAVARMADASLELPEGIAPVINFDVINNASDFNSIDPIEAPEDAMVIPLEALQQ
ncbi:MAG: hypothetical protein KDE19_18195 [Caldilineaceae bacterium]|nr:hypothetical protein [Caldilineaceae bacterium]